MSEIGADKLTRVYIKMRDKLRQMQSEFEQQEADLKAKMQVIEEKLLEICKETGADSIKTPHGTIMRGMKTRY